MTTDLRRKLLAEYLLNRVKDAGEEKYISVSVSDCRMIAGLLVDPEGGRSAEELEARIFCLEDTLRPFALWADSMYTLKDDQKVCGIYVRHFRDAARVLNGSTPQGEPSK